MFAECCVFNKQSQPPGIFDLQKLCAARTLTSKGAPSPEVTVPFCRVPSPKLSQRLSILYLSTCVGLRYGFTVLMLRGFSWKRGINHFDSPKEVSSSRLRVYVSPDLPKDTSYSLKPSPPFDGRPSLLRHPIAAHQSTGILTCFPSTTLFSLALGADSPCSD